MKENTSYTGMEIAIIGMACHFPGAANWRAFWQNLAGGVESVTFYTNEALEAIGINESIYTKSNFVKAASVLDNKEEFDHAFFDYRPAEAAMMHPMHRLFHQCVWEALEDAGQASKENNATIGLYAGGGNDLNWRVYASLRNREEQLVDDFTLSQVNSKDYLSSLIAYKLNLRGPSFTLNTACSTSLVAVNMACKSLLLGENNVAIAGGIAINTDRFRGYLHEEGMINSADGHCRTFDKEASGTIGAEGAGVVVLKRLTEAIKDKDHIYAIIKGSVINNDGNRKIGYTAPSMEGQLECIRRAQKLSKVHPDTIGYIEAHGTGTRLGDPIEVHALQQAYPGTAANPCALGSVKSNFGHLDAAAGVAGLIKAALILKFKQIPPSLHFTNPNPEIDFSNGRFYVNTTLKHWNNQDGSPLRAAVSSFGIGGTNAHVILEQAPATIVNDNQVSAAAHVITLSAKTQPALARYINRLQSFVNTETGIDMASMAHTYHTGRAHFVYRKAFTARNPQELSAMLAQTGIRDEFTKADEQARRPVVFMFSGAGSQYEYMGYGLYQREGVFKQTMDEGFRILQQLTGRNYRNIFYPAESLAATPVNQMEHTQPVIFLFAYSLAQWLISINIRPQYLIGHSIGEYVAACLSGVFSFEDALRIVVKRGRLLSSLPAGAMISASLSAGEAAPYCHARISMAAINAPRQVVFSGDTTAIDELSAQLTRNHIDHIRLHTSHAGHCHLIDEITGAFEEMLNTVTLHPPGIPFFSNLTGAIIQAEQATSAAYWAQHMRHTVKFSAAIQKLLAEEEKIFIEIGGGHSLTNMVRQQAQQPVIAFNTTRHPKEEQDDHTFFLNTCGRLWETGVKIDWERLTENAGSKIPLPAYCFEKNRYTTEIDLMDLIPQITGAASVRHKTLQDWFYKTQWKQSYWLPAGYLQPAAAPVLLLTGTDNIGWIQNIISNLQQQGIPVITAIAGKDFSETDGKHYTLNWHQEGDLEKLLASLKERSLCPGRVMHFLNYTSNQQPLFALRTTGFDCLLSLARSFVNQFPGHRLHIDVVGNGWFRVYGNETIIPEQALCLGAVKGIPKEFDSISCRAIDIADTDNLSISSIIKELNSAPDHQEVAIRGRMRYIKGYEKITVPATIADETFSKNGTYLITGANGAMAACFAQMLAAAYQANIILTGKRQAAALEQLIVEHGGSVTFIQSDLADRQAIHAGLEQAEQKLGQINGVIHTAGLVDLGGMILNRTNQGNERVFGAKVYGTNVLTGFFANRQLDFFINCSSFSATNAPFGEVAYVAANLYQDAWAEAAADHTKFISIEWPPIKGAGAAVKALEKLGEVEKEARLYYGITLAEAWQVLQMALYLNIPVPIICTQDFRYLFENKSPITPIANHILTIPVEEQVATTVTPDLAVTDLEKRMMMLVQQFLGRDEIGVEDNFLELGLDSLKTLTLSRRMNRELGTTLALPDFFKHPSIRQLAALANENRGAKIAAGAGHNSIQPVAPNANGYQVSSHQERLWFMAQFEEANQAYNIPRIYFFNGRLNINALQQAFDALIARHEILRTVFRINGEGQLRQYINEPEETAFRIDMQDLRQQQQAKETLHQWIPALFTGPFNLSTGPLLRAALYQLQDTQWVFAFVMHHIISDGVSMNILIRELLDCYNALVNHQPLTWPPLKIQYKDYAHWQQQQLQSDALQQHRRFWLELLQGELPVLQLPTDRPRPAVKTYNGSMVRTTIPPQLTSRLREQCRRQGATLFMGLVTVLNALLYRYTGQHDIIIGTPVAAREHADLEDQIGFYVNTLPIRTSFTPEDSFSTLLQNVKQVTLQAYQHQAYPFDTLVDELSLSRDPSRSVLFDVMAVHNNRTDEKATCFEAAGLEIEVFKGAEEEGSKFDLSFNFAEQEQELYTAIEFNTDLFDHATINRLATHFINLLTALLDDQQQAIASVNMLAQEEEQQLLHTFNDTGKPFWHNSTLTGLFYQQAANRPNDIALIFKQQPYTYAFLNQQSEQLAAYLVQQQAVRPGHIVAIQLVRSEWMIIAILAILKTGAAYLPIDPDYPEARVAFIKNDSQCTAVIDQQLLQRFQQQQANDSLLPALINDPEALAYVIYTSGSTGTPKGVMIQHRAIINRLQWMWEHYRFSQQHIILQKTTCCFDVSVWELFLPLCFGARMVLCEQQDAAAPERIARLIDDHKISVIHFVPTMLAAFTASMGKTFTTQQLSSLELVFTSGEALPPATLHNWYKLMPAVIHNLYGPTEASVDVTYYPTQAADQLIPIGKPIWNTQVYILTANNQLAPPGIAGEICLAGVGLAKGYLNNEALTQQKFRPNPFHPGQKIYRTGDTGRWLADGNIEYLGRTDNQVKVRGYRIETAEVEIAIAQVPGIREAVVMALPGSDGLNELVAYITAGHPMEALTIKEVITKLLPAYMVPAHYIQLDQLPTTPNGKTDRKALAGWQGHTLTTATPYTAPQTQTELELVNIWSEVLGIEAAHIGIHDNFFDRGGHSLLLIKLQSAISQRFNANIPIEWLFNNQEIGNIARYLQWNQSKDRLPLNETVFEL